MRCGCLSSLFLAALLAHLIILSSRLPGHFLREFARAWPSAYNARSFLVGPLESPI